MDKIDRRNNGGAEELRRSNRNLGGIIAAVFGLLFGGIGAAIWATGHSALGLAILAGTVAFLPFLAAFVVRRTNAQMGISD